MRTDLFLRAFGQNRRDSERLIDDDQLSLASSICDIAHDEISLCSFDDDFDRDSVISFEEKVESTMILFRRVVEVFEKSNDARESFLRSFDRWAKACKSTIKSLGVLAEEMQKDKFNSDIARVVGGVVGTLGGVLVGLSFLTPLAVVTVPLAIGGGVAAGLGGGVVAGTSGTEIVLVKNRLEKVKTLVEKEKERFSAMTHWFAQPEELENAINSLIDYDIIKEIAPDVHRFVDWSDQKDMTEDEFRDELTQLLRTSVRKMNKDNQLIIQYGKELAPIVITFVFVVCLMKKHNLIVLDCVMVTQRLAFGLGSVMDFGVLAGALIGKLAAKGFASAIAKFAVAEIFTCLGILVDVTNVVLSSIDIHKRPETVHTKKIKEVAEKFEKIFLFIEGVYNETKKYKTPFDDAEWSTFIVGHVPDDAGYEDLKTAVRRYLPKKGYRKIKIGRMKTKGNNWQLMIPEIYAEELMKQTEINIKGKNCIIMQ